MITDRVATCGRHPLGFRLRGLWHRARGRRVVGHIHARLYRDGELVHEQSQHNLVTQVGDQYYGERAAGIASPPGQVTGMRLGTNTATAASKTGAGAAIVTYKTGTSEALDAGYPQSSLSGSSRRITWRCTWEAGEGTDAALGEVVITNETPLTDVAGAASNTISRAILSPTINKGANDTLEVTWHHDVLGT